MQESKQNSVLRDEGLLEGAVMRQLMAAHDEDADLITQTPLLIAGIALSHAFVAGNERTALAASMIFLDLHGFYMQSATTEFGQQIEALVKHVIVLEAFIVWMSKRLTPLMGETCHD